MGEDQPMGDAMVWLALIGGLIGGTFLGMFIMCLVAICKRADHPEDYPDPRKVNDELR